MERLQQRDAEHLIYAASKPGPGGSGPQILTPLELIDRLAALVPPPRVHRHRYYGVLASNSPLRYAVTAMASPTATLAPTAPHPNPAPPADEPIHRRAARYARVRAVEFPILTTFPGHRRDALTSAIVSSATRLCSLLVVKMAER